MGRGPGITQRAILDALTADQHNLWLTISQLAERTSRSPRQIRTAVHALHARGLVAITKGSIGWKGRGDYGKPVQVQPDHDPADPKIITVQPGSPIPGRPGWSVLPDSPRPLMFIKAGVPVSGLSVCLADRKAADDEAAAKRLAAFLAPERP